MGGSLAKAPTSRGRREAPGSSLVCHDCHIMNDTGSHMGKGPSPPRGPENRSTQSGHLESPRGAWFFREGALLLWSTCHSSPRGQGLVCLLSAWRTGVTCCRKAPVHPHRSGAEAREP